MRLKALTLAEAKMASALAFFELTQRRQQLDRRNEELERLFRQAELCGSGKIDMQQLEFMQHRIHRAAFEVESAHLLLKEASTRAEEASNREVGITRERDALERRALDHEMEEGRVDSRRAFDASLDHWSAVRSAS
ncbi:MULTISPECIES: hypothetical protein [Pseudoxanthomonas]|uniref:hypothetical protein n=1 Tax=Pseudoxanthomonas TaxID=83618 RepID=UPI0027D8BA22|nr:MULTISPECIES: hypothetical protein [Pseudoxanthomonas]